jgi:hypothetical protein
MRVFSVYLIAGALFLCADFPASRFGGRAAAVPIPDRPETRRTHPDLVGTYALYARDGDLTAESYTFMKISQQQGSEFVIGIAKPTGHAGMDWKGRGIINGKQGHYDWVFPDGKTGRTTITIDADGNLCGQVRGSGIDWDYVAKRREGPVKLPER